MFSLSCANCSAPLEVDGEKERFVCGYCGSAQVLERKGGTVALKKVENAIHAVQRGTDRTAAELAIPRLTRERDEALAARAAAVKAHSQLYTKARSGRTMLAALVFAVLFVLGGVVIGSSDSSSALQTTMGFAWLFSLIALPAFVFSKVKLPPKNPQAKIAEYDARLSRIEEHLRVNRSILDSLPS